MPIASTNHNSKDSDYSNIPSPQSVISAESSPKQLVLEMDEKPRIDLIEKEAAQQQTKSEAKVDIQEMVDDTVRRVRDRSDKFQAVAQPYADKTRHFAETRPVLFTFVAIFIALSVIPIGFFIGFLLCSTAFILGVAAIGICLSCLGVILFGASILLPILLFTSLMSLFAVTSLLSIFLAHRLYLHLQASTTTTAGETVVNYDSLSVGIKSWFEETRSRAGFEVLPAPKSPDYGFKPMPTANNPPHADPGSLNKSSVKWENDAWVGAK